MRRYRTTPARSGCEADSTKKATRKSLFTVEKSDPKVAFYRDPAGARTQDPNIKSVVLYQLSYGIPRNENAKVNLFFQFAKYQPMIN